MIKQLRRRHYQIWLILLVVLPLGIIGSILVVPPTTSFKLLQPQAADALPLLVKTINGEGYTINLRKNKDDRFQLEWINNEVLTFPTAVIYITRRGDKDLSNAHLIGRIEARGIYRFDLKNDILFDHPEHQLIVYDFIHKQIINTINF